MAETLAGGRAQAPTVTDPHLRAHRLDLRKSKVKGGSESRKPAIVSGAGGPAAGRAAPLGLQMQECGIGDSEGKSEMYRAVFGSGLAGLRIEDAGRKLGVDSECC